MREYILENRTINGKYQWLWFKWFDLMYWFGYTVVIGDYLIIKNFNINSRNMKKGTGSYAFAVALNILAKKQGIFEFGVGGDGKVTFIDHRHKESLNNKKL